MIIAVPHSPNFIVLEVDFEHNKGKGENASSHHVLFFLLVSIPKDFNSFMSLFSLSSVDAFH